MDRRLPLHDQLLQFSPNVYFQPPSDVRMTYPCIVYTKTGKLLEHANNRIYQNAQEYQVTVMDFNPDTTTPDLLLEHFPYSSPGTSFVRENINHTTLKLYF